MDRRSRNLAITGVMLATVMQAVDGSIVNVALPIIQRELHGSLVQVGWTVTGYAIASLVAMPLAAGIAARIGMRRYFAASIALFTVASAACGLARSAHALVVFRLLQGFGAGGLLPLTQGIVMTLLGREQRGLAVALVGFAAVMGPLLGPPIGGVLTDALGWQSIFWINLPIGAISVLLVLGFLRTPARDAPGPLDVPGAALLAAAIVCLQVACAHHAALVVPAAIFAALFVLRERRTASPAVDLRVLRNPPLAGTLLAAPLYGVGLYGSVFLAPLLLEKELRLSASAAGLAVATGGVASALFIVNARALLRRIEPRRICAIGATLFAVSMCWHARLALAGAGQVMLPQALRGAGTGMIYVGMNGFAFDAMSPDEIATGASLFYLLRQLGGALGVALCASALDASGTRGTVAAFFALAATAPISLIPMALAKEFRGHKP